MVQAHELLHPSSKKLFSRPLARPNGTIHMSTLVIRSLCTGAVNLTRLLLECWTPWLKPICSSKCSRSASRDFLFIPSNSTQSSTFAASGPKYRSNLSRRVAGYALPSYCPRPSSAQLQRSPEWRYTTDQQANRQTWL